MDLELNSKCICNHYLSNYKNNYIIYPCNHLIHFKCLSYLTSISCPYCHYKISNIQSLKGLKNDLQKNIKKKQQYIDLLTVNDLSTSSKLNYFNIFKKLGTLLFLFGELQFVNNRKNLENIFEQIMGIFNIKIKVKNIEKLNRNPTIFIANHTNYLDSFVLYKILNCNFLASYFIKNVQFMKNIIDLLPILLIKRGNDENTVTRIKNFMEKGNSLCIFPEGFMNHPKTLARFRTGAFRTGFPVQPVLITYKPYVMNNSITTFLLNILSQDSIIVEITILDPEYPPFTSENIERIRKKMGLIGNMSLSRVSNRDIID